MFPIAEITWRENLLTVGGVFVLLIGVVSGVLWLLGR